MAPAQNSYMCRLRIPNGILKHWQMSGLADLAERYGGGYSHVTTRANLQIREIEPKNAVAVVEDIQDLGLCSRGSGADNIRNVTGTPTAGIDPQELIDTRPYAREWHFHILNERALYGLPRKFNVAFDGAGIIPVLEDTNDIGFQAVEVKDGFGVEPGVWFQLALGGITGHKDFARDTGVIVKPADATKVADAVVRVFIDHGDRTNRNKARLKYVLDAIGFDKYLALVEEKLGSKLVRVPSEALAPRPVFDRSAHIGVHKQKQNGLHWLGVVLPVGKLTAAQMCGLAAIAQQMGDGDIRLTVWQNLLISGIPACKLQAAEAAIEELGLSTKASSIRAGLVACTGNVGCRFSASDTKRHAEEIARWCEARVELDGPVNIHLTGCHHSCAQHYIGDIGLLGLQGAGLGGRRSGRGLSHPGRRRLRARCGARPRTVSRCEGGGRAGHHRAHAQDLSGAPRLARRELPGLHAPPRDSGADRHVCGGRAMNSPMRPPLSSIVPENAPFTDEQRVWLNGFFAGLLDGDATALSPQEASALMPGVQIGSGRGRRRRALARPDHAAGRAHEARRRPSAAAAR